LNIYLIRHTLPKVAQGICYGRADLDVTDTFDVDLERLLPKLEGISNPLLLSSPLRRCLKLAEQMAEHFEVPLVKTDARLMELNFGDWELKNWADIPQGVVSEWSDVHIKQAPPNGESYVELHARAKQFFAELSQEQQIEHILVFTHAGVIRALVSEILGKPLTEAVNITVDYGSVTHISIHDGVIQLGQVNY
jgi:alpha-ribazole phosphatase